MINTNYTGKSPKISVIIPIFNVEKFLSKCLDSVLSQTFKDFEAICINDGSPDNCDKILEQYAFKDSRIKVISQKNQGLSIARNNGVNAASGEYIYFLDSDDFIHPQLLEYAYNLIIAHNADLISFEYVKNRPSDDNKENEDIVKSYKSPLAAPDKVETLVVDEPLKYWTKKGKFRLSFNVWTKLYKKELIKDFSFIPNIHYEDYPFVCSVLSKKPKCVLTKLKMYYYTCNPESISNKKINPKQIKDYHAGVNYIYNTYNKPELTAELNLLKSDFIPNILKQQLAKCKNADKEIRPQMYETFAEELYDLNKKNLISWHGHNILRYLTYKRLIKAYEK
ncbi:MAG: glycosyltransferase [Alphaproteobacteria bacterium]|nr:glycosyltransferase [Alphaproteobacteria bacterium]